MQIKKLTFISAAVLAVLLIATLFLRMSEPKYTLPDFTGQTKEDIISWMTQNNIPSDKTVFIYSYSDTVPENTVITQSIKEGKTIPERSSVTFTLSKGEDPDKRIMIADFTGMNQEQIEQWLKENGFTNYSFASEINDDAEEGLFLYSDPKTESRITRDDEIIITMCEHDHSATVALPDFTGKTAAEIEAWAAKYSITVNYIYYMNEATYGSFLFSDIAAGTEIEKGGYISVAVSSGSGG